MIDFLVREVRTITKGMLTFIQLGDAPTSADIPLGTAVNVKDAVAYELDFNEFSKDNKCPYRFFKKPVEANSKVFEALQEGLKNAGIPHAEGRVASNPSFSAGINAPTFKSGGTGAFDFKTEGLKDIVEKEMGPIATYEMDTYPLYWIAGREVNHEIRTGCVSVVNSDLKGNVLPADELRKRQVEVAKVILEQLGKLQ
jgi:uridine phosphorylase